MKMADLCKVRADVNNSYDNVLLDTVFEFPQFSDSDDEFKKLSNYLQGNDIESDSEPDLVGRALEFVTNSGMKTCNMAARREPTGRKWMENDSRCMTKQAISARENRLKKKEYVRNLETSVKNLRSENEHLKSTVDKSQLEISSLNKELTYLKNVLANQSTLSALLKNIVKTPGVTFKTALLNFDGSKSGGIGAQSRHATTSLNSCNADGTTSKTGQKKRKADSDIQIGTVVPTKSQNTKPNPRSSTSKVSMEPMDSGSSVAPLEDCSLSSSESADNNPVSPWMMPDSNDHADGSCHKNTAQKNLLHSKKDFILTV